MRFLVDQPISWEVAVDFAKLGHDAIHVRDVGWAQGEDEPIVEYAAKSGRIIVTQDTDYGTILVTTRRTAPSVILFRMRDGRTAKQVSALKGYLPELESSLHRGAIVVIDDASIRIRSLT